MKPGDWTDLTTLPRPGLVNRLDANLDALRIDGDDPDNEDRLIAALPEPLRVLYLLSWMDFEVSQGSLIAYLFNSHGRHARAAASALRVIGAEALADVVDRAAELADSCGRHWQVRHAELDAHPASTIRTPYDGLDGTKELRDLTDEYWAVVERDDEWGSQLEAYLSEQVSNILEWAEPDLWPMPSELA